jgi:hypothetical protein
MTSLINGWGVEVFLAVLMLAGHALIYWASKEMPQERWQFVATIPRRKLEGGLWDGLNLTWYGALTAIAFVFAVALVMLLAASVKASMAVVTIAALLLCAISLWASRAVAQWVEGIANTHTVGGALFVVVLVAPLVLLSVGWVGEMIGWSHGLSNLQVLQILAAMVIGYTFGEGIGRVACISFGCCWGVRVDQLKGPMRKVFERLHFKFHGPTKKIAYASNLAGIAVVPIQAMTAIWHVWVGVMATWLFLIGQYAAAMVLAMALTQLWRFGSEFIRADFRGFGRITKYQWMALATIVVCALYALWLQPLGGWSAAELQMAGAAVVAKPNLAAGLAALWSPWSMVILQGLFVAVFMKVGRSSVTKARMRLSMASDEA